MFRAPSCVPMVASVTLRDAERIRGGYNAGITLIQDTVVSAVMKAVSAAIRASARRFFSRCEIFIAFSSFCFGTNYANSHEFFIYLRVNS